MGKVSLADFMSARLPSNEELEASALKQREDREARSRRDLFNPFNLGHWIALCERVGVPFVPAEEIARVSVEDLLRFDEVEHQPAVGVFFAAFDAAMATRGDGWMARWSCCAGSEVKHRLSEGQPNWHQDMVRYFTIDDPRAYDLISEYPEATVAAYARPWMTADILDDYPIEYRVYVADSRIIGIANYYPQRPLANDAVRLSDITQCYGYAERLLTAQKKPLNAPRLETHWDATLNHWTADFMRLPDGSLVFLEGGPPFTPNGGAHPCCFMGRPVEGVALAASSAALDRMGLSSRVSDERPPSEDAQAASGRSPASAVGRQSETPEDLTADGGDRG